MTKLCSSRSSVAGNATTVVFPANGLRFVVDIGITFDQAVAQPLALFTHSHVDHVASIAAHASTRNMLRSPEPIYVMPPHMLRGVQGILDAFGALDGGKIPASLTGTKPGDMWSIRPPKGGQARATQAEAVLPGASRRAEQLERLALREGIRDDPESIGCTADTASGENAAAPGSSASEAAIAAGASDRASIASTRLPDAFRSPGITMKPFRTHHRVLSQGYVCSQRSQRLKAELVGMPGKEIGRRRKAGEDILEPAESPLLAITGDTTVDALLAHPTVRCSPLLVTECTCPDRRRLSPHMTRDRGHLHVDDIMAVWAAGLLSGSSGRHRLPDDAAFVVPGRASDEGTEGGDSATQCTGAVLDGAPSVAWGTLWEPDGLVAVARTGKRHATMPPSLPSDSAPSGSILGRAAQEEDEEKEQAASAGERTSPATRGTVSRGAADPTAHGGEAGAPAYVSEGGGGEARGGGETDAMVAASLFPDDYDGCRVLLLSHISAATSPFAAARGVLQGMQRALSEVGTSVECWYDPSCEEVAKVATCCDAEQLLGSGGGSEHPLASAASGLRSSLTFTSLVSRLIVDLSDEEKKEMQKASTGGEQVPVVFACKASDGIPRPIVVIAPFTPL